MTKLILYVAISVDGYIARPDGSVDWCFQDQDYGYNAFYETIDALIMGRNTYEKVLSLTHNNWPYRGKKCYIFSRKKSNTHFKKDPKAEIIFVNPYLDYFINQLKDKIENHIWFVGGGDLLKYFQENNLIDEYILSIHPILLGNGIKLFKYIDVEETLELIESKIYEETGLVQLHYKKK